MAFLEPFEMGVRHLRAFAVLRSLSEHEDERLGYVVEDTTVDPAGGPWKALLHVAGACPGITLPGRHGTQEEALAALLATVGGT